MHSKNIKARLEPGVPREEEIVWSQVRGIIELLVISSLHSWHSWLLELEDVKM
jgi:hypothetical protein